MAATPARSSRPACVAPRAGSRWRSSNDRTWPEASPSCPSDGPSSGPSHGSTAAVVWPRIGNASTATRSADSGTKGNGLSEADLDVPAKLFEEGLQRREEAEALPRRQVVAEHDLLQLGVTERVEVEVPRQVAAPPAYG